MDYFETIKTKVADLDIGLLAINAGAMQTGRFDKQSDIGLQQMMDANVYHFAAMLKKFLGHLNKRPGQTGVIIEASVATLTPLANNSTYHASKTFEFYLCKAIQSELSSIGSRVEVLIACPSFVYTTLLGSLKPPPLTSVLPCHTVKDTLKCIGYDKMTFGCISHELQSFFLRH